MYVWKLHSAYVAYVVYEKLVFKYLLGMFIWFCVPYY